MAARENSGAARSYEVNFLRFSSLLTWCFISTRVDYKNIYAKCVLFLYRKRNSTNPSIAIWLTYVFLLFSYYCLSFSSSYSI